MESLGDEMKLSDAMMLGATQGELNPSNWDCCLLGLSAKACGSKDNWTNKEAERRWPWIMNSVCIPKLGTLYGGGQSPVENIVSVLAYDVLLGKVSWESVVDWVRSVEPAEEPIPVTEIATEAVCA